MKENTIFSVRIDERAGYRRDEYYPNLIFLFSVLRWCVHGNVHASEAGKASEIIRTTNLSLDSTSAFLADHIESGGIPVINVHSRLPLGSAEKNQLIEKLRSMDGGSVGGLSDEAGLNYYLDGKALFSIVKNAAPQIAGDFRRGGVWHRLAWDAPKEWHEEFNNRPTPGQEIEKKPPELDIRANVPLIEKQDRALNQDSCTHESSVTTIRTLINDTKKRRHHLDDAIDRAIELDGYIYQSVWATLKDWAISPAKTFVDLIGFVDEGIQYRGKKYQKDGEYDILTYKQLSERIRKRQNKNHSKPL